MGWMGNWLGNWMGSWFGLGQQQQPSQPAPYTRYGRVFDQSTDRLFGFQEGSWQCEVSSGAVILSRTDIDDYVRMRVPDTDCPPLPEPNAPLDSGLADEAEPNRWQIIGTPNTSNKWLIKQQSDQIQLAYTCYSGDFVIEVSSDYVSKTGTCTGDLGMWTWDGVALMFELGGKTFGIGVTWAHKFGLTKEEWGGQSGRSYLWFVELTPSDLAYSDVLIPNTQTDVRYRVQRSGSNIRFGMLNSLGNWEYSIWWESVGTGEIQIRWEGVRLIDNGQVIIE
jgi:hypothetical protein